MAERRPRSEDAEPTPHTDNAEARPPTDSPELRGAIVGGAPVMGTAVISGTTFATKSVV